MAKAGGAYIEIRADDNRLGGDLNAAERKMNSSAATMQRTMKRSFVAIAAASAVMGLAVKTSVSQFAAFEKEMANVSTLVDTNVVSMKALQKELLALPANLGSATGLTKGLYQALSAGVSAANAVEFVGIAAMAAKAGLSDTFTAVDAGTTILNAFGMATKDATFVYDLMFKTVKEGKTTFSELASAVGKISPIASAAGVSVVEMHAALATLTKGGFKTTEASARLATALGTIIKPSKEAQDLTKQLGLEFNATALRTKGLHGFLQEVAKATDGNVEQMALLFGGMESLSVMLALAGKQSEEFTRILEGMGDVAGEVKEAFDKQKVTLTEAWETFKNTVEKQAIKLGGELAPAIDKVLKKMTAWVEQNDALIAQKIETTIDKITTSIGKMITVYNSLPNGVIGAAGTGIIVGILTGSHPIGWAVAGLMLLNTQLERFNMNIGAIPKKITAGGDVMNTFADIFSGKRDWDTGALKGVALEFDNLTRAAARSLEEIKNVQTAAPSIGGKGIGGVPADGSVAPPPPPPSAVPSQFAATSQRFEGGFQVTEGAQTLIDADKKKYEEQARLRMEFNTLYMELGKSQFDLEREQILTQSEVWKLAGANKIQIAQLTSDKIKAIDRAEKQQRLNDMQSLVGGMAANFKQIAEMGGKHSKKAFAMYKAFKITETLIATYSAAIKAFQALAPIPIVGPALGVAAAAMAVAFGMAQVQMIRSSQPPSYDQGGISSAKGVYQTGNIDEAHIPLKGGKVPVNVTGGGDTYFIVKMENPVFQDAATQRQVFAQLAEVIAKRVAPGAVVQDYQNDGQTRQMIRGRA